MRGTDQVMVAVGVFLPTLWRRDDPAPEPTTAALRAEELGFESVWVVDQLVAGRGSSILESTVVLAGAATVTNLVRLGLGILIVPLRGPVWVAKHVAALQFLSHDRLVLGVGVGGDRHGRSWRAAGVPRAERGARLDAALEILPDLVAGREVGDVQLAPGATVPPILVGGAAAVARRRAERHDGWFAPPIPVAELEATLGEMTVPVTTNLTVAITGDRCLPTRDAVVDQMVDPDGLYGMPRSVAGQLLVYGDADDVARRLRTHADAGAERVVVTFAAGDWQRQAELLAGAVALSRSS